METFTYKGDALYCEDTPLAAVAARFGTPCYVYSQAAIRDAYRAFEKGLAEIPHLICYSVKANSNLNVLRLLREEGAGFDVVSGGELTRALKSGVNPQRIVFSGVGKTAPEVDAAIAAGILIFNVESEGEMALIEARAEALGKVPGISVRINPDVEAETHPYIATGQAMHKFGVPKSEALALYRKAQASTRLRVRGMACHIGSQILDSGPFLRALDEVLEMAGKVAADGASLEFLDLGGGYGIRYDEEAPLDVPQLSDAIRRKLRETQFTLIVEPGRALVGGAGVLLTQVLYVKRNEQKSFVIVDGGMNDLIRPALYGSYHRVVPVARRATESLLADVVGPLCETGDFLARDREMPEVQPGDLLAVLTAGAYGFVLASNYNSRPRPAEVMVKGSEFSLIRRRERMEDLLASEEQLGQGAS